jgi:hypothetical protein
MADDDIFGSSVWETHPRLATEESEPKSDPLQVHTAPEKDISVEPTPVTRKEMPSKTPVISDSPLAQSLRNSVVEATVDPLSATGYDTDAISNEPLAPSEHSDTGSEPPFIHPSSPYFYNVSIVEPVKVGDVVGAHMVYKVMVKVSDYP